MDDCIFCKIIDGRIPSYKIYEDEDFVVILDRFPSALGHTLIIPRKHSEDIFSLDEATAAKLYPLAIKMSGVLKRALNPDGLNILQNNGEAAGQTVMHFHMHLIPRFKDGDAVTIKWTQDDPSPDAFEKLVTKLTETER